MMFLIIGVVAIADSLLCETYQSSFQVEAMVYFGNQRGQERCSVALGSAVSIACLSRGTSKHADSSADGAG